MFLEFLDWSVSGFRSFKRTQTVDVRRPGLFQVVGSRSPGYFSEKGSNGTGKSSMVDALCWTLYGKTVRGQRAKDVVAWDSEEPTVGTVRFRRSDEIYTVTRTQDPNSLTIQVDGGDPEVTTDKEVADRVGLRYETFCSTVVMSAWGRPFMLLDRAEKLSALSAVLGLDVWTEHAKASMAEASTLESSLGEAERALAGALARVEENQASMGRVDAQIRQWQSERGTRSSKLKRLIRAAEDELARYSEARIAKQSRLDEAVEEHERMEESVRQIQRKKALAEQSERELTQQLAELTGQRTMLEKSAASVESLAGGHCDRCRQSVPRAHVDRVLEQSREAVKDLADKIHRFRSSEVSAARHRCSVLSSHLQDGQKGLTAKAEVVQGLSVAIRLAVSEMQQKEHQIASMSAELQSLQREECPWISTRSTVERRLQESEGAKEFLEGEIQRMTSARSHCLALSKIYRDIRLWVCSQAMEELGVATTSSLEQLGLVGWEVRYLLEKPTKKGEPSRGFQMDIRAPGSSAWVPWESWSGGETQRLIVAGSAAFSDMCCSRLGIQPSVEIWDELTNHLSQEGIEELLEFALARARVTDRTVLFIDHQTITSGVFDGTYQVHLNEAGTSVRGPL